MLKTLPPSNNTHSSHTRHNRQILRVLKHGDTSTQLLYAGVGRRSSNCWNVTYNITASLQGGPAPCPGPGTMSLFFSPTDTQPSTGAGGGGGGKARVVEGRINTPPSPPQLPSVWPGTTATGLKMPASPSHPPLPSSFQLIV